MAKKLLAVVTADCHLAPRAWLDRPALSGDAYHAFTQIVDYAAERNLPLLAAGDLLDVAKPPSETVGFLCIQLERLQAPCYFIQGQHERATPPWFAAVQRSNVHHLHRQQVRLGSLTITGLDWLPAAQLAAELETLPENTDVLLCHQVWTDFMGSVALCEGTLHDIPHAKLVITGDYHVSLVKAFANRQGREGQVLSPGSTCMQSIDEPVEKFFYTLDNDLQVQRVPLQTRPRLQWSLRSAEDLAAFVEELPEQLNNCWDNTQLPEHLRAPLVWVEYDTTLDNVYSQVVKGVGDRGHLFRKPLAPEAIQHTLDREQRKQLAKHGLLGCLPLLVTDRQSQVYSDLERLLAAPDASAELRQMREEALTAKTE